MNFKIGDRVGRLRAFGDNNSFEWFLGTIVQIMDRDEYKYAVSWDTNPIKRRMHQGDDLQLVEDPNQLLKDLL